MKKHLLILTVFLFISFCANAQYTSIPDSNFEQELINDGHDSEGTLDGQILTADVIYITTLNITGTGKPSNQKITNLTGIEDFINLEHLYSNDNLISQIDLTQNTNLQSLRCNNNVITALDLTNNPRLNYLSCFNNQIQYLDLSNVGNLYTLNCRNNDLSYLDISNGFNSNMIFYRSDGNPNLQCVTLDSQEVVDEWNYRTDTPTTFQVDASTAFSVDCASVFISTWKTNNPGTSSDYSISIPTSNLATYNYNVDWGDDQIDIGLTGSITHTYSAIGVYTVTISGRYPHMYFANSGDKDKILSIENWGSQAWSSMDNSFYGCSNLVINATDNPDLSQADSLVRIFSKANSMNQDISGWNVSSITNMGSAFQGALTFNQDISSWDVSNVTNMNGVFWNADAFNKDISGWNVGNVTSMASMFRSANNFNQNIGFWNVSKVTNMNTMFASAVSFDQDLGNWDISSMISMNTMFFNSALSLVNYDATLINWNTLSDTETQIPENIAFNGGNSQYCNGEAARISLTSPTYNWTIADGGKECASVFITTWETANPGTSNSYSITIPTSGTAPYNYAVNWGDGTYSTNLIGTESHRYNLPGTYTVTITGDFPYFSAITEGDNDKLLSVEQWGDQVWTSMEASFYGCSNVVINATDTPDLSQVTSISNIFQDASSMNQDISAWDVSTITSMEQAFLGATSFNQNLGAWDISNVSNMTLMFDEGYLSVENYDNTLIGWSMLDLGEIQIPTNIVFSGGYSKYCNGETARTDLMNTYNWTITDAGKDCSLPFVTTWKTNNRGPSNNNQITIPAAGVGPYNYAVDWGDGTNDTNITTDITHTYTTAGTYTVSISGDYPHIRFNNTGDSSKLLSVEEWGDQEWISMEESFYGCTNLVINATEVPNLSQVTSFNRIFRGASAMNQDINAWDVSNVIVMSEAFRQATAFNQSLNTWNLVNVVNMRSMFYQASSFNQDISSWNVGNVENMSGMFSGASVFNQDISSWNVSRVINMSSMFHYTAAFNQDISGWDVSNVLKMNNMFFHASPFNQDLGSWDISSVINMTDMFTFKGMSTSNYDNILIGWNTLDPGETQIPTAITFSGGNSKYCSGEAARTNLINTYGWTITDYGIDCSTLGLNEDTFQYLRMYPNPVKNNITILLQDNATYSLLDINGRLVKQGELLEGNNFLNLSVLSNGVYILKLKLKINNHMAIKKIIKE